MVDKRKKSQDGEFPNRPMYSGSPDATGHQIKLRSQLTVFVVNDAAVIKQLEDTLEVLESESAKRLVNHKKVRKAIEGVINIASSAYKNVLLITDPVLSIDLEKKTLLEQFQLYSSMLVHQKAFQTLTKISTLPDKISREISRVLNRKTKSDVGSKSLGSIRENARQEVLAGLIEKIGKSTKDELDLLIYLHDGVYGKKLTELTDAIDKRAKDLGVPFGRVSNVPVSTLGKDSKIELVHHGIAQPNAGRTR